LLYVVVAPLVMSVIALAGSDPFARKWGPIPVVLGPVVYLGMKRMKIGSKEVRK
jgi:hypothetical protein